MQKMAKPKRLSLYIHIPFCIKKCNYCDFPSTDDKNHLHRPYVEALIKQMREYALSAKAYQVDTVYIGGGTPTLLASGLLKKLLQEIKKNFSLREDAEITCEANPQSALYKTLRTLRKGGVNRLSIGLQSADDAQLKVLGRQHAWEDFEACYTEAKKAKFENIGIDIMFSLPKQTKEELLHTLEQVVKKDPAHISCYSLTIAEDTPFGRCEEQLGLPNEEEDRAFYRLCNAFLEEHGYSRYEISNFAKENAQSRHNFKYWNCEEYLGLGAGAHSYYGGKRFCFTADIEAYITGIEEATLQAADVLDIPYEEAVGEYIMLQLRTTRGIEEEAFRTRFRFSFAEEYAPVIEKYKNTSHMDMEGGRCFLTLKGIDVSNYIISDFLAHPVDYKLQKNQGVLTRKIM